MTDEPVTAPVDSMLRETLLCLFIHGPTWDGDVPSKSMRDEAVRRGLAARGDGYQWLTDVGARWCLRTCRRVPLHASLEKDMSPFADRRTEQQLESARKIEQERADQAIEKLWRERVRQNVQRRLEQKWRQAS